MQDNGKGIDKGILHTLFHKFTTKSEIGTGLGLYISKNIVEAHGGTISGYNNPDGKGATFEFTLILENSIILKYKMKIYRYELLKLTK